MIAIFGLGVTEVIIIAIVIIVLFGARKIPDLFRGMGKGIKDFKKEVKDGE